MEDEQKEIKMNDVIEFMNGLKELRIKDALPFGTCDYMYIDDIIKYLKSDKVTWKN